MPKVRVKINSLSIKCGTERRRYSKGDIAVVDNETLKKISPNDIEIMAEEAPVKAAGESKPKKQEKPTDEEERAREK